MEEINEGIGNLPFALTQISKPARKHLKTLAASLLQYHRDLPARDPELLPPEKDDGEGPYD
jgi:hypothetical protein